MAYLVPALHNWIIWTTIKPQLGWYCTGIACCPANTIHWPDIESTLTQYWVNLDSILGQCWPTVCDAGPTFTNIGWMYGDSLLMCGDLNAAIASVWHVAQSDQVSAAWRSLDKVLNAPSTQTVCCTQCSIRTLSLFGVKSTCAGLSTGYLWQWFSLR